MLFYFHQLSTNLSITDQVFNTLLGVTLYPWACHKIPKFNKVILTHFTTLEGKIQKKKLTESKLGTEPHKIGKVLLSSILRAHVHSSPSRPWSHLSCEEDSNTQL